MSTANDKDKPIQLVSEIASSLTQPSQEIDFENLPFDIEKTAEEMYLLMQENRGLAIACPQVGSLYRMFVILVDTNQFAICINPEIIASSEETTKSSEGCLTFPYLFVNIIRNSWIDVKFYDGKGKQYEQRLEGIHAKCFQHEIDHLNGILFIDRATKLSLKMAKKKRLKFLKRKN